MSGSWTPWKVSPGGKSYEPDVERVLQHPREAVEGYLAGASVAEPPARKFIAQCNEAVRASRVELKGLAHDRRANGIKHLRLAAALVEVADGRREWVEALLEAAIEAFAGLLPAGS